MLVVVEMHILLYGEVELCEEIIGEAGGIMEVIRLLVLMESLFCLLKVVIEVIVPRVVMAEL